MSNITPKSLEALLKRLIDYAGLFPPASLPLDQAFKNFIEYTSGDYNWMLSNFIIPAKKLDELTQLIQGANTAGPLRFSISGPEEILSMTLMIVLKMTSKHGRNS